MLLSRISEHYTVVSHRDGHYIEFTFPTDQKETIQQLTMDKTFKVLLPGDHTTNNSASGIKIKLSAEQTRTLLGFAVAIGKDDATGVMKMKYGAIMDKISAG